MNSISIIIATHNAGKYLQNCLNSIIIQKGKNTEIIIVDGGSKDNTLEIINNNRRYITYWISEPDNGIYDAWNKGVSNATGNWIMFLGSDDLLSPKALEAYRKFIDRNQQSFDIISSKLDYVNENGTHIKFVGEPWNWEKLKMSRLSFAHPGLLHNAKLFKTNGLFDNTFKICGDSEFFLRTQGKITAGFLDFVTVKMQRGGVSYSVKAIIESYQIRLKNRTLSKTNNILRFLRVLFVFYLSKIRHNI